MIKARAATWAGFVAIAAAILACGFVRWPLSEALVRDSLNVQAIPGSTLRWASPDAASFRALPWPSLHFYNARLNAAGGSLLSAPEARVDLSLGGLLRGRLTPTRAILVSPIVVIDLDAPPFSAGGSLARLLNIRRALAPLTDISLANGVVRIVDKNHNFDTVIEDVRGRVEGIGTTGKLSANLSAVWRDTPLTLSGSLAALEQGGGVNALLVGLKSPVADLAFVGGLALAGAPSLNGNVMLSVRSISGLSRLSGLAPPVFLASDDMAISGKIKVSPGDLTLGDATITSAAQTLQGALRISEFRGRAVVSGTLDSEQLAIEPLFGSPKPFLTEDGRWSRRPFALSMPRDFDLDLRLSAALLDIYGQTLTNAAASVLLKGEELTVSLIEAAAYGGKIEGEARLSQSAGELDLRARAKIADADFGAAFSDLNLPIGSGAGTAEFAIATGGRAPADAISRLKGTATLVIEQGSLDGVNLEEALRRSQRRPLELPREMRAGETSFDRLSIATLIGGGVAHIGNGDLLARGLSARLRGDIDLTLETLDLTFDAMQTDASGEASKDAARLSLAITGPWAAPTLRLASPAEAKPPSTRD